MKPCEFCHHREADHIPECIDCPVGAPCLFYVPPENPPEYDAPGVPIRFTR